MADDGPGSDVTGEAGSRLQLQADETDIVLFLEDSTDQLELLDRDLVRLEQEQDDEILQGIFRAAHCLKGSSATIGHTRMAELTHAMESVLDALRNHSLAVSTAVIDTLLQSLDARRVLTDEVSTLRHSGMEVGALAARLLALLEAAGEGVAEERGPAAERPGPEGPSRSPDAELDAQIAERRGRGLNIVQVSVALEDGCTMPAVRLLQCLMALGAAGEILDSQPSEAEIEREDVGSALSVLLATDREAAEVPAPVEAVPDVRSVAAVIHEGGEPPAADVDERQPESGGGGEGDDRRIIDLGPEARGASQPDQLRLAASKLNVQAKSIRIDVARLDKLMNFTGELVINRGRLAALVPRFGAADVAHELTEALNEVAAHLGRTTTELQDEVMKSRMLPMEHVVNRFPRMVRDLARKADKRVDFQITGQETELDRSVIEEIGDPLTHLLRNAMDHGIELPAERTAAGKAETGTIHLDTSHEESTIVIRVRDDGRGIDPVRMREHAVRAGVLSDEAAAALSDQEALDLIWMPGYTTAKTITDVSGRGVGMDIVKTNILKLNGRVSVQSEVGRGTTVQVRVPLTLAVIEGLVLRVAQSVVVVPISSVTESLRISADKVKTVQSAPTMRVRGVILPLIDLAQMWRLGKSEAEGEEPAADVRYVVAVHVGDQRAGLIVDELLGEQEVVIKSLGGLLRGTRGISGATLMGDEVALIVDVPNLLQLHYERQRAA